MNFPFAGISVDVFEEYSRATMAEVEVNINDRRSRAAKRGEHAIVTTPGDVVRAGELTQEEASVAWTQALKLWGMVGSGVSTEEQRQAFFNSFVIACITATSADEENLGTRFKYNDNYYDLYPIRDAVHFVSPNKPNPLRCFVRSYDYGRIPLAIMDTLDDAENMELRQGVALRCDGPVEHAKYMFDTIDGAINLSGRVFTSTELGYVRLYRARRTDKARVSAQSVGMDTAPNDVQTATRKSVAASAPDVPTTAKARLNFPTL